MVLVPATLVLIHHRSTLLMIWIGFLSRAPIEHAGRSMRSKRRIASAAPANFPLLLRRNSFTPLQLRGDLVPGRHGYPFIRPLSIIRPIPALMQIRLRVPIQNQGPALSPII